MEILRPVDINFGFQKPQSVFDHTQIAFHSCLKEATIGILNEGDFFGEGYLTGQPVRLCAATAMTDCSVMRIGKKSMMEVLHREHAFSDMFVAYLPTRNIRYEEDLVHQLFNSSEKRLARVLLLLAQFGKDGKPGNWGPLIITPVMHCKSTVHFSMLFSTTRTSFQKNRTLLSCGPSHSRLRHFLDDFSQCRFGRLLFCFSFIHLPMVSRVRAVYWSIWINLT